MRKKVFQQTWRNNFGFAKFNHFASPSHGFFNGVLWKDSYSTQRVLYKTFFNGNQFQATGKGQSACKIEGMCFFLCIVE